MNAKIGVLIVGLRGATASTVVATACPSDQEEKSRFLITEQLRAAGVPLARVEDLVFGGWDIRREPWETTLARHGVIPAHRRFELAGKLHDEVSEWPGIALEDDHAAVTGETAASRATEALARLRQDIRRFRLEKKVEQVVVISLGAPAKLPPLEAQPVNAGDLIRALEGGEICSALPYYFAAAMLEGAAVVDYTASTTLEMPGLIALAEREKVPFAGRDGSTGQTLLKSVLAETFATRRLRIRGWYSTNILGNHDGLVLQDQRYSEVKHHDKTALLEKILGYSVESHLVDIRYYLPAGDEKEAWDAIDFETWGGGRGQLRVNWRSSDSLLATPPILDLLLLTAHARATGRIGVQAQLGMFFKNPLGTEERRYLQLAAELAEYYGGDGEQNARRQFAASANRTSTRGSLPNR
jgi:myo-inositol-1-phosphate synthase